MQSNWAILKYTLSLQIPHLISFTEKYCACQQDQPAEEMLSEPSPVGSLRRWERHPYTKGKLPILTDNSTLKPPMSDIQHHLRWDFTSNSRICTVRSMSIIDKLSNV